MRLKGFPAPKKAIYKYGKVYYFRDTFIPVHVGKKSIKAQYIFTHFLFKVFRTMLNIPHCHLLYLTRVKCLL